MENPAPINPVILVTGTSFRAACGSRQKSASEVLIALAYRVLIDNEKAEQTIDL